MYAQNNAKGLKVLFSADILWVSVSEEYLKH